MKKCKNGAQPAREASRRLGGILRTARKLGIPEHELANLPGAKRLCRSHNRWPGLVLSLGLFLGAVIVLYVCSAIPSAFHCPRNTSALTVDYDSADTRLASIHDHNTLDRTVTNFLAPPLLKASEKEIQTVRAGLVHEEADSWLPSLQLRKDR